MVIMSKSNFSMAKFTRPSRSWRDWYLMFWVGVPFQLPFPTLHEQFCPLEHVAWSIQQEESPRGIRAGPYYIDCLNFLDFHSQLASEISYLFAVPVFPPSVMVINNEASSIDEEIIDLLKQDVLSQLSGGALRLKAIVGI